MVETGRDDLFTAIHKALRSGMLALTIDAGRIDWCDPSRVESYAQQWERVVTLVRSHAGHEERYIWPLLESKKPGAVAELGVGHDAIDGDLDALDAVFTTVRAAPDDTRGLTFYRSLNRVLAHTLEHFSAEEPAVMDLLWSLCTDDELAACRAGFMSEIGPEEAGWTLELMLEYISTRELVAMLHGMQSRMPPPVFAEWLQSIRGSLPPGVSARLGRLIQQVESAA